MLSKKSQIQGTISPLCQIVEEHSHHEETILNMDEDSSGGGKGIIWKGEPAMTTEQEKVLEALQTAVAMENDGKECYLQAAVGSKNEAGKKLLQSLAEEEDIHRQKLETIYKAISTSKSWPEVNFDSGRVARIRSVFAGTCEAIGVNVGFVTTEIDVLKTALDKEKKSYDFYERQAKNAIYEIERNFYKRIASEEREHELALLDYYEYLIDPAGWFVKTEHHSLDGG